MGVRTYDEWMNQHFQDLFLVLDMIDVLALDDIDLLHRLDREFGIGVLLQPAKLDISEGT